MTSDHKREASSQQSREQGCTQFDEQDLTVCFLDLQRLQLPGGGNRKARLRDARRPSAARLPKPGAREHLAAQEASPVAGIFKKMDVWD